MKSLRIIFYSTTLLCIALFSFFVHGQTVDELNQKIDQNKNVIKQLDLEIKKTSADLEKTSQEKTTLQSTIKILDTTKKKLDTDIKITQSTISTTDLTINKLDLGIKEKQQKIDEGKQAIAKSMRSLYEIDSQSLLETMLSNKSMSDVWNHAEALGQLSSTIKGNIRELQGLTRELEVTKNDKETQKKNLESQKKLLSAQKQSVVTTQQEKNSILAVTKNKESNFKKLLADKMAKKDAFEKELFDFEQQLKIKVDPNSYPAGKTGILFWPLAKPVITQYFGKTVSAKKLYVSGSHNGVDFGTPIGTPVKATLSGTVTATGNTDVQPGCYSFGKWVLISHPNGLSTLYGHLSVISVSAGQEVSTGDILGLSGNTGYSTGPHLHFGVYATQGMRVEKYANSTYCKNVVIPIADKTAYLDPMLYLPH